MRAFQQSMARGAVLKKNCRSLQRRMINARSRKSEEEEEEEEGEKEEEEEQEEEPEQEEEGKKRRNRRRKIRGTRGTWLPHPPRTS